MTGRPSLVQSLPASLPRLGQARRLTRCRFIELRSRKIQGYCNTCLGAREGAHGGPFIAGRPHETQTRHRLIGTGSKLPRRRAAPETPEDHPREIVILVGPDLEPLHLEASECSLETHDQCTLEASIQLLVAEERRQEGNLRNAHPVLAREVCQSGCNDLISSDHRPHQPRLACRRHQLFCGREAPPQGSFPGLRESWEFLRSQLTNLHAGAEKLSVQHGCHRAYVAVRQAQSYPGEEPAWPVTARIAVAPIGGQPERTSVKLDAPRHGCRWSPCSPGSWERDRIGRRPDQRSASAPTR